MLPMQDHLARDPFGGLSTSGADIDRKQFRLVYAAKLWLGLDLLFQHELLVER